ncbi:hypothetical protein LINPERPRIM_LOCUS18080 [Linum perenne]
MTTHVFINIIAFIALSALLLHGVLGDLVCEELPVDKCAYSISESGKRCVLENYISRNGMVNYQCKTSEVVVDNMKDMIESEECIKACGVDRNTVGISSDYLLTRKFVSQLCSRPCFQSCPNIVDLYSNLALAEGMDLYGMCSRGIRRRSLFQPKSSSDTGAGAAEGSGVNAVIAVPIGSPVSSAAAFGPSSDA